MSKDLEVLPIGWYKSKIKDIFSIEYGRSLVRDFRNENGPYPVIGSSGIVGYHDSYLVEGPSVVIGRKGSVGSITLLKDSSWPIDTVYFVQPPVQINIKFVYYQLLTLRLEELDRSTTIPGLNRNDLYNVDFLLCPESEQNLIVEKLEELLSDLDKGVAELKTAQEKLTQYRQTLLKSAVEGSLTKDWREANAHKITETGEQLLTRILKERRARWEKQKLEEFASKGQTPPKDWQKKYPESVVPDTNGLPELPAGWIWSSVDSLIEGIDAGKSFKCLERPPKADEYGVIKISAVTWGVYNEEESKTCTIKENENSNFLIKKGNFLFSRANTTELVGACVIAENVTKKIMLSDKIWRINFVEDYLKHWVLQCFKGPYCRRQIELIASGNQVSMKNISQDKLRALIIPIASIQEMSEINSSLRLVFNLIDNQLENNEHRLKQAEYQRKNILNDAFSGMLIEQNSSDEPASMLLDRIRAERNLKGKNPKLNKPNKKPSPMNNCDLNTLKSWIKKYEGDSFTFDDIDNALKIDYELLKNLIFDALSESSPLITQCFDKKSGEMIFKRTEK